ncbi:MAG: signal peptidase I [Pseudonocardiales bacterium]|nr:signal peptidase I [Actinomycetota bacterium]PZS22495.1 MAG: signal peptidase I [Pseudonocardiales bacterium]
MAHLARSTEPARGDKPDEFPGRRVHRHRLSKRKKGSFWREVPILVLTALLLTFLIQTFIARVYVIPSASMEPTLHGCPGCTNDRVLVDKLTYRFRDPAPGDVVVFRGTDSWASEFTSQRSDNILINGLQQAGALVGLAPPDERDFVKRVIAVGGQTVQCCDKQNRVTVNGSPLTEPYAMFIGHEPQEEFGPVTVPHGNLWLMGDNRDNSADSRRHVADQLSGTQPVSNVIGKARVIVLPLSRWQGISDPDPQQIKTLGASRSSGSSLPSGLPLAAGLVLCWPVSRGGRWLQERVVARRRG